MPQHPAGLDAQHRSRSIQGECVSSGLLDESAVADDDGAAWGIPKVSDIATVGTADGYIISNGGGFARSDKQLGNRRADAVHGNRLRCIIGQRVTAAEKLDQRRADRFAHLDAIDSIHTGKDGIVSVGKSYVGPGIVPNQIVGRQIPCTTGRINDHSVVGVAAVPEESWRADNF